MVLPLAEVPSDFAFQKEKKKTERTRRADGVSKVFRNVSTGELTLLNNSPENS